jgi:hypothetical protein
MIRKMRNRKKMVLRLNMTIESVFKVIKTLIDKLSLIKCKSSNNSNKLFRKNNH